jgi:coenzyme F420-0:L-glutamate ligase/coenzyme F420-1:gamma-L-glutamate ligase
VASAALEFHALAHVPEVTAGADLAALVASALDRAALELRADDVVVVAQKVVSKAEGRWRKLDEVLPGAEAVAVAARCGKDARLVELVLQESSEVVRVAPNVLITRHRRGWVMANAGIDHSNTGRGPHDESVLLLPEDPDASARRMRSALQARYGVAPGVIVSDSFGRPWRLGTVNVAIGVAGLPALIDLRGAPDRDGRTLQMTQVAVADALAAGAGLVMGEATEGTPVVLVRGYVAAVTCNDGQSLIRAVDEDLFR